MIVGVSFAGLPITCAFPLRTCQTKSIEIKSITTPAALVATIVTTSLSPTEVSGGAKVCGNCGLDGALVVVKVSVFVEISVTHATPGVVSTARVVIVGVVASPLLGLTAMETNVAVVEDTVLLIVAIGNTHAEHCC